MIGYRKQIYIYEHIYNIRTSSGQRQLLSSIVRRLATLLVAEKHANQEQQARKRLFQNVFYKNSKRTHTPLAPRKVYRKPRGRGCFTAAVGSEVETEGCFVEPEEPKIGGSVLPENRRKY